MLHALRIQIDPTGEFGLSRARAVSIIKLAIRTPAVSDTVGEATPACSAIASIFQPAVAGQPTQRPAIPGDAHGRRVQLHPRAPFAAQGGRCTHNDLHYLPDPNDRRQSAAVKHRVCRTFLRKALTHSRRPQRCRLGAVRPAQADHRSTALGLTRQPRLDPAGPHEPLTDLHGSPRQSPPPKN
jgi:hypothetical protein